MKPLRVALGLALAVLATLALGALRFPAPPDFFLLVVADMARGGAAVPAMLAGLPAGLLEDALQGPSRLLGLHAFTKILVGYLLATMGARTVVEKPLAVGGLLAGAVLVEAVDAHVPPLGPQGRRSSRPRRGSSSAARAVDGRPRRRCSTPPRACRGRQRREARRSVRLN